MKKILGVVFAFVVVGAFAQQKTDDVAKGWWNHVKVLADDKMEGRETGSPGMQRAADYVISQLKKNGIKPAGSNGYYQPVKFVQRTLDESKSSLALVQNGKEEPITLGD
jgi:hypothetical protein